MGQGVGALKKGSWKPLVNYTSWKYWPVIMKISNCRHYKYLDLLSWKSRPDIMKMSIFLNKISTSRYKKLDHENLQRSW